MQSLSRCRKHNGVCMFIGGVQKRLFLLAILTNYNRICYMIDSIFQLINTPFVQAFDLKQGDNLEVGGTRAH